MAKGIRALRNLLATAVNLFNRASMAISMWGGQRHQLLIPQATYAPWLVDEEFLSVYRRIEQISWTGIYQCWELWDLARQLSGTEGDLLEVGVWKGATSAILGRAMEGSDSELFCCDTFRGLVKSSPTSDPHARDGALKGPTASEVRSLFHDLGIGKATLLEGIFPDETGSSLEGRQFKLCHIDVDTRRSAHDVAVWIFPRLVVGGTMVFQDYGYHRTQGITALVDDLKGHPGLLVVHNLNGSALVVKTSPDSSWPLG